MAFDSKAAPDISGQIFKAVSEGNSNFLRKLLNRHPDYVNIRNKSWFGYNETPLHTASRHGEADVITLLLQKGASVNEIDKIGDTPLHVAVWGGVEAVKVLCEHGADINMTNKDGYTPLHVAAICGQVEAIKVLCERGANVNMSNKDGNTPLHIAALCGKVEAVKVLCEHGANVNMTNEIGNTPLHYAQNNKNFEIVKILTEYGAVDDRINKNAPLEVPTLWPNRPVYTQQQLQPPLYYPSASMIQPPYQQQYQQPYPTATQQIIPPITVQPANRNIPPTIIPDNSAVLRTTPHQSYNQTTTKRSKAIKIVNPETMKDVDTSNLKKTSPASSARSTPTESKSADKSVESKENKESTDDVKTEDTNDSEYVAKLKYNYEKRLSAKEAELNDAVKGHKLRENEVKVENEMLKRRIEQLRESSKKYIDETVEVTHATDYIARVKEINQLKDTVSLLKIKEDVLETENKNLKLHLRSFSKESFDDVPEFKSKADGTTENVATLKNDYEKEISAKQIEINQLEDDISVLKIKQIEIETENRRLKSRIEKSRDSSKKHVEYQNKLKAVETENKKLKLEIEQLRKSSKLEDTVDTDSSNVNVTSKILKYGSYYVSYEAQYCGKKCMAKKEDVGNNISKKLLKREGKFLHHLNHPCVVQHLVMLNDLNTPVLLMEKMSMSLTQFLERKRSYHVKISILCDTARGLHYIHDKGIIHSDLNGDNILLTENVTAKLADFGRANFCRQHMKYLPETSHHLPPEIFEPYSKANCSTKVDVFSFGCVIIHTFTQDHPIPDLDKYVETSEGGKYKKHSEVERRSVCIKKIKKDVNTIKFYNIVLKCLQDNPDHRPTVATLLSLLDKKQAINLTNFFKFASYKVDDMPTKLLFESEKYEASFSLLAVERLKLLTTLNVSGCNITKQGADLMSTVLLKTVSLNKLDLSNTMLDSTRANKIICALKTISSIKVLNMNNNDIDDEVADSITVVLCSNRLMEHINLSHNKLTYAGVLNIANSLSKNIKKLDISSNFIASDNVVDLAAALSKYPLLQELNISHNLLKLTGVLTIARFLRHHPTLKLLDLSNNNVSFSSACEFIVDVILSVNKPLVNLNVCGRNIRPRYVKDYLSPPRNGDETDSFALQNLYLLKHSSLNILTNTEANVIKVTENCPISSTDIISYYVDHLGGVFYNRYNNFVIVIPPGAVSQGDCVEIQATADYFAPYIIPEGFYPISSYYWFSANYEFKTPIYSIMNHYAKIRSLEDIKKLHVLHKCARDPNAMNEGLITIPDGVYFDKEVEYCVLATDHFCTYCGAKSDEEIPEYLTACYYTYDESSSGKYIAEVAFFPSSYKCKKVITEQCRKRNTEIQQSVTFDIVNGEELHVSSIDFSSVNNHEWRLIKTGKPNIIHLRDFEFWKIFKGLTKEEMREREETFDYPPRLRIECVHIDSSKPLCSSFTVSKKHNNVAIGEFLLVKQVTVTSETTAAIATSSSINTQNETLNKKPEMFDLTKIVIPKIVNQWEYIAEALRYELPTIQAIKEKEGKDQKQCCREFFKDWLMTNNGAKAGPKVWSTLLNTLKEIDEIAADITEDIVAKVKELK